MIKRNLLFALAACVPVLSFTSCGNTRQAPGTPADLVTVMSVPENVKAGSPVMLKFTVQNKSAEEMKFCKWHTPFEGWLNNYLDIKDANGAEVPYTGAMAKRVMPPPEEAYLKVPAGETVSSETDLLKGYRIEAPGKYTVIYQGNTMSGLEKVNEVSFTVTE